MALNTRGKRSSAINPGCPWWGLLPPPDGAISSADRADILYRYALAASGRRIKGSNVRFVDQAPDKPKLRPKPKPVPVVPEAQELLVPAAGTVPLFGPPIDMAMLHRMARFHPQSPTYQEPRPVLPEAPAEARFMAHLFQQIGAPSFLSDNPEQFFEQFIRHLGMEP